MGSSKGVTTDLCLEASASPFSSWHQAHPPPCMRSAQPNPQIPGCDDPTTPPTPPWSSPLGAEGPTSQVGKGFQAQSLEPIPFFGKVLPNHPVHNTQFQSNLQLGRPLTPAEVASAPSVRVGNPQVLEEPSGNSTGVGTPSPGPAITILGFFARRGDAKPKP